MRTLFALVLIALSSTQSSAAPRFTRLYATDDRTCVLAYTGEVYCWGFGDSKYLGVAVSAESPIHKIQLKEKIVSLALTAERTCAVTDAGTAVCFGSENSGELGFGSRFDDQGSETPLDQIKPVVVPPGRKVLQMATQGDFSCMLVDNHDVRCWGRNLHGELGQPGQTRLYASNDLLNSKPVNFGPKRQAMQISAGAAHACALLDDSSIQCWGDQSQGQLAAGKLEKGMAETPVVAAIGSAPAVIAKSVVSGPNGSCVILKGGRVKCWGSNGGGRLGLLGQEVKDATRGLDMAGLGDALPLTRVDPTTPAIRLAIGESHACALLSHGLLKCWGANDSGQLGLGDTMNRGVEQGSMGDGLPVVDLGNLIRVRDVAVGRAHTCALIDLVNGSQKIACWGDNSRAQLGATTLPIVGIRPEDMGATIKGVPL